MKFSFGMEFSKDQVRERNMKMPSYRLIVRARRILWGLIIAHMLGVHNFYKGEDKALDDIIKSAHTIEQNEVLEDDAPKN